MIITKYYALCRKILQIINIYIFLSLVIMTTYRCISRYTTQIRQLIVYYIDTIQMHQIYKNSYIKSISIYHMQILSIILFQIPKIVMYMILFQIPSRIHSYVSLPEGTSFDPIQIYHIDTIYKVVPHSQRSGDISIVSGIIIHLELGHHLVQK